MNPYEIIGKIVVFGVGGLVGLILLGLIVYQIRCAYFSAKLTKWLMDQEIISNPGKNIKFVHIFRCWWNHFDAHRLHITAKNGAVWRGPDY
jgi:hypothetical protein